MAQRSASSRMNSFLSVWYGVMLGSLQAFLIVQNVRKFVWFAELPWPFQRTPYLELNSFIILTGVAVTMLPFFLAAAILRVDNMANDNVLLGKDVRQAEASSRPSSRLHTVWTHSGPTAAFVHLVSSLCLLLPHTLIEAALLKHGYLAQDALWQTDLDVLLPQGDRDSILKILGGLEGVETQALLPPPPPAMRLEYFNYALALLVFSLRYAGVFWDAHKAFAALFSLQALLMAAHSLIAFSATSVLYKVGVVGALKALHRPLPLLLGPQPALILLLATLALLLLASSNIYFYGYHKLASFQASANTHAHTHGVAGYLPHCSALALLIALAAIQSPLIYDTTLLYNATLDNALLLFVVSGGLTLLLWALVWVGLTTKRRWLFNAPTKDPPPPANAHAKHKACVEVEMGGIDALRAAPDASMLVVAGGKAVAIDTPQLKHSIINLIQRWWASGESAAEQRGYSPKGLPSAAEEAHFQGEACLLPSRDSRNKVTFVPDDNSPSGRKSACAPPRRRDLLQSYPEPTYAPLRQEDEGDYAVLKRGRGCLRHAHCTHTLRHGDALFSQGLGRALLSTDSGYQGTDSSTASSPPDRSTHSDLSTFSILSSEHLLSTPHGEGVYSSRPKTRADAESPYQSTRRTNHSPPYDPLTHAHIYTGQEPADPYAAAAFPRFSNCPQPAPEEPLRCNPPIPPPMPPFSFT